MSNIELTTADSATLAQIAATLRPPVLTEYPTTDASKAGQRFIYKGNEWHYMTQAEITSIGWDVPVGFPAPVSKTSNPFIFYRDLVGFGFSALNLVSSVVLTPNGQTTVVDILGMGNPKKFRNFPVTSSPTFTVTGFINANLLTELEDIGTSESVFLSSFDLSLTTSVINQFFTDLPPTVKTATIDIRSQPGTPGCDPSIATAKGYTVITS